MLVKGTRIGTAGYTVIFKNYSLFVSCFNEINKLWAEAVSELDLAILMYDLIEYNDSYSKTSGSLWQYHRDEKTFNNDVSVALVIANSESFKFGNRFTGGIAVVSTAKDVEMALPLTYSSNFWRTIELHLINCEISIKATWSEKCIISSINDSTKFQVTNTKPYVPVVTLATKGKAKL